MRSTLVKASALNTASSAPVIEGTVTVGNGHRLTFLGLITSLGDLDNCLAWTLSIEYNT